MKSTPWSAPSVKHRCGSSTSARGYGGQVAFIQDAHSMKNIMKAQDIPDFQAPPAIPKFIDTAQVIDELPSYDSFEPLVVSHVESSPDDF